MPTVHNYIYEDVDGESEVSLQGSHSVRITAGTNNPKIFGFVGGEDGIELNVHNLSGGGIEIVNLSGNASAADTKIHTTGLGGSFTLPDGQIVWMIKVDPNIDPNDFPNAKRGWYLDSGGQEVLLRDKVVGSTSGPTTSSSTFTVLEEMLLAAAATVGGTVILTFDGSFSVPGGAAGEVQIFVDGSAHGDPRRFGYTSSQGALDPNPSIVENVAICAVLEGLAAGDHDFDVRWRATAGTLTAYGVSRELRAIEIP